MSRRAVESLRPWVCQDCRTRIAARALRLGTTIRAASTKAKEKGSNKPKVHYDFVQSLDNAETVERRIANLGGPDQVKKLFPRLNQQGKPIVVAAAELQGLYKKYGHTQKLARQDDKGNLSLYGRVWIKRIFGAKLAFMELATSNSFSSKIASTNIKLKVNDMLDDEGNPLEPEALKKWYKTIQRGDWLSVRGTLGTDANGNRSINATQLPTFLAPTLQMVPEDITDPEFRMHNRHADMIVHPSERDVMFLRARLLTTMRKFFNKRRFVEVNTPLLQGGAGGAIARPFETSATEFSDVKLNLRVAPELFLKRLVVGGMSRVFEIGPAFRNEGIDTTHNPEFTTCEFYGAMLTLDELMAITQKLFVELADTAMESRKGLESIPRIAKFPDEFAQLEFIPTIEAAIRDQIPDWTFPDLLEEGANEKLLAVFETFNISRPAFPNLPRLLDALAGHFIEPQCTKPTFITYHPECMSPLAKSFSREALPTSGISHRVSARAELFIAGREYVNCYEEENSPLEQRRKFEDQLLYRRDDDGETGRAVDENYLGALEWGMPPTGGWGCGIDRIVMLLAGKTRIADVLPFGTLRNVVALSGAGAKKSKGKLAANETVGADSEQELRASQSMLAQSRAEVEELKMQLKSMQRLEEGDALEGSG